MPTPSPERCDGRRRLDVTSATPRTRQQDRPAPGRAGASDWSVESAGGGRRRVLDPTDRPAAAFLAARPVRAARIHGRAGPHPACRSPVDRRGHVPGSRNAVGAHSPRTRRRPGRPPPRRCPRRPTRPLGRPDPHQGPSPRGRDRVAPRNELRPRRSRRGPADAETGRERGPGARRVRRAPGDSVGLSAGCRRARRGGPRRTNPYWIQPSARARFSGSANHSSTACSSWPSP